MTPTTEKIQPPRRKIKWANSWIFIILFVLLVLTASRVTPAVSSYAPVLGTLTVTPSLSPFSAATAARTSTPTANKTAAPSSTPSATATAASTSTPTASQTTTPSSALVTTLKVTGNSVNLRAGPDTKYGAVRKLARDEMVMLLGRLSDDTWLYVKTSDGQEGWISTTWVELTGINVVYHPIITLPPQETTVKVNGGSVNLRAGPNANFSKIQSLAYGELLLVLGRLSDNTWLYVKTSDGQVGWIKTTWVDLTGLYMDYDDQPVLTPPPTETATPWVLNWVEGRWINIDLSEQMLYAYEDKDMVASFLVSTGISQYPTERGIYHIYAMFRYSDMHGTDYFLPDVPNAMYYSGDFSIHGTYWHHNFGTPMSHGCVNMDISDAEWLYNWASIGTLVFIHR